MQICVDTNSSKYQIRRYEPPWVWINEIAYNQSLIIMPDQLIPDWRPLCFQDIKFEDFHVLLEQKLDILLLGTGRSFQFASAKLTHLFLSKGIGLEVMATEAAIRTYVVLSSEQRKVAAALILE